METVGIVAEYNPFHRGHLYQLELARERVSKQGCIIIVMSGDWVQRGGPAVLGKWSRAALALEHGADLILELPAVFATQSAQYFADGAVRTLAATGICRNQLAGSESADPAAFDAIATVLAEEPERFVEALRGHLEEGMSYAVARTEAVIEALPTYEAERLRNLMTQPNHTLNLAYAVAAKRHVPRMHLHSHARIEGSATEARGAIERTTAAAELLMALAPLLPPASAAAILHASEHNRLLREAQSFPPMALLLRHHTLASLQSFAGMNDGIAERLSEAVASNAPATHTLAGLVAQASSKRYPHARVRRAIASATLGITQAQLDAHAEAGPQYLRVLGFSKQGRYALKLLRKHAKLPVITKASDFLEYSRASHPQLRAQADQDLRASDLRSWMVGGGGGADFAKAVIIR